MKERDLAISIILSVVTFGIYGIYWFIVLTNDINEASEDYSTSGGISWLLTLITCGIYGYFWAYKMGKSIAKAKERRGVSYDGSDSALLFVILQVFGLSIVNLCIMQYEINKMGNM